MNDFDTDVMDTLAALLRYPEEGYLADLRSGINRLCACGQTATAVQLEAFLSEIELLNTGQIQELYIQTFDISALCTLEVGWHVHGDNYDRGDFLVRMRGWLRALHVAESDELPDHLTHVLAVLGRLEPAEALELAVRYAEPAVKKMLDGLAGKNNAFEHVLKAIRSLMPARLAQPVA
jgi:nitrate reductase molybdenum cofactor assembly chaperone